MADRFAFLERIGEGTFGEVHKARHVETGQIVALKRVRLRNLEDGSIPNTALREIRALRELRHPNVVRLLDVIAQPSAIMLVFEFMESDLSEIIRSQSPSLPESHIKAYMQMLLQGVAYCHANDIIHRDLKPSNLMLRADGVLTIGDFGLARVHVRGAKELYTHQVATRWYRAPELLFGAQRYGFGVDLWAVGAIFAELLGQTPLFPGENDIDQIYRVLQILGTPTPEVWPGVRELPDYDKIKFPSLKALPFQAVLPNASPEACALLAKFLVYNPASRISAADALKDPYFRTEPLPADLSELRVVARGTKAPAAKLDLDAPMATDAMLHCESKSADTSQATLLISRVPTLVSPDDTAAWMADMAAAGMLADE